MTPAEYVAQKGKALLGSVGRVIGRMQHQYDYTAQVNLLAEETGQVLEIEESVVELHDESVYAVA
jgi:hypothetical protein